MNGQVCQKAQGNVVRVTFGGQGINSGSLEVFLEPVHLGFEIYMDTPRKKYFELFETACSAMWDSKRVEVTYYVKQGDNMATDIRIL